MKVFKAPLEKIKKLISNYQTLKKQLEECKKRNEWLNWQIDKLNKGYT